MFDGRKFRRRTTKATWPLTLTLLAAALTWACNSNATFFNDNFLNLFTGSSVPIVPGPDPGYVMVMVMNNTSQSIEFIVTAQSEEIVARLDGAGNLLNCEPGTLLEPKTVNLVTDVDAPSLAIVFDNTPAEFPPVAPGTMTFEDCQDVLRQLVEKDAEALSDRDFIRLVRVIEVGLGPELAEPSGQDNGIVVRPPGSDQATTAGTVFPSGVNNALSYDAAGFGPQFGNGDAIVFVATTDANAVGGVGIVAGVIDGGNTADTDFDRPTFDILRREEGPISPPP